MATAWSYIPFIGLPVLIRNNGDFPSGTDIPRNQTPGSLGKPRPNTLKTFLGLVPTGAFTTDDGDGILIRVQAPRVISAADIVDTEGEVGFNDAIPIVTFTPGSLAGVQSEFWLENVSFTPGSDLVDVLIHTNNLMAGARMGICIDFSHSITN